MTKEYTTAKYIKIAIDIAYRIHNGELKEGSKVSGRSTLASSYNVSPETVRRSIALLKDMHVVQVTEKSGVTILSKKQAGEFIEKFKTRDSVLRLKNETHKLLKEKKELDKRIENNIESLVEYSSQLKNVGVIYPFEVDVPENSHIINRTVSETNFWHNTNATIVGVKRKDELIISPGPYFDFVEGDTILFVGNEGVLAKVEEFIFMKI